MRTSTLPDQPLRAISGTRRLAAIGLLLGLTMLAGALLGLPTALAAVDTGQEEGSAGTSLPTPGPVEETTAPATGMVTDPVTEIPEGAVAEAERLLTETPDPPASVQEQPVQEQHAPLTNPAGTVPESGAPTAPLIAFNLPGDTQVEDGDEGGDDDTKGDDTEDGTDGIQPGGDGQTVVTIQTLAGGGSPVLDLLQTNPGPQPSLVDIFLMSGGGSPPAPPKPEPPQPRPDGTWAPEDRDRGKHTNPPPPPPPTNENEWRDPQSSLLDLLQTDPGHQAGLVELLLKRGGGGPTSPPAPPPFTWLLTGGPEIVAPDLAAPGQEAGPAQPSLEWNLLRDLWVQPDPGHSGLRDQLG